MASFTHGVGPKGEMVANGTSYDPADFTDLVDEATVQGIGGAAGEISPAMVQSGEVFNGSGTGQADTSTPALRKLGTGDNDAAAGSQVMTADKLKFGSNTAIPLNSTNPTNGQLLKYNSGANQIQGVDPVQALAIDGTGKVTTVNNSAVVTGTVGGGDATKFTSDMRVGDNITIAGVTWTVLAIASDSSLTIGNTLGPQSWGVDNLTPVVFTYTHGASRRPWNTNTSKSSDFTVAATDVGQTFIIDNSGADVAVILPAVSGGGFYPGDTVAFIKKTEDDHQITLTCAGTDLFTDGSTVKTLKTVGAMLTLVGDGASHWHVVASERTAGTIIQTVRRGYSAKFGPTSGTKVNPLTSAFASTDGDEIITLGGQLKLTPTSTKTQLRVRGYLIGGLSGSGYLSAALFNGATLLGSVVTGQAGENNRKLFPFPFEFFVAPPSKTEISFSLRVSPSAGNYYLNQSGERDTVLGGNIQSWIEVSEEAI